MKSKEYIRLMARVLEPPLDPNWRADYQTLVDSLYSECSELTRVRLQGIEVLFAAGGEDLRIVRAYQEGQVKWGAVYGGLEKQLGRVPPEPFHMSGFFLPVLLINLTKLTNGERDVKLYDEVARAFEGMLLLSRVASCPRYRKFKTDAGSVRDSMLKKAPHETLRTPASKYLR